MKTFGEWMKIKEGAIGVASGPYIGGCKDTATYQVLGACSDCNSEKKNKKIRDGDMSGRK